MKKGRFLWSAHRITEKQKAGKARNIKEKQLKNSLNTASKPLVAHLSSASADYQYYLRTFRNASQLFARLCAESWNRLKPWNAANRFGAC